MGRIRIAVLASGSGSDCQSVIDACRSGAIDGDVVLVVSNNPEAPVLGRASRHGIEGVSIPSKGLRREEHEALVIDLMESREIDLMVLAGYVRMLTPLFIGYARGRAMNIHPTLLPLFGGKGMYGLAPHEAVIASGMKVSGCTVHFVDERVDGGPIIAQRCVPVVEGDTPESLQQRVLIQEHILLPEVVPMFAQGRLLIEGDRVRVLEVPRRKARAVR